MFEGFVRFVRQLYCTDVFIPLHRPYFLGDEKDFINDAVDSTFVSSVGKYVDEFEAAVATYTGTKYAVATMNGTAALHIALKLAGVTADTEVITQSLTFVATCNAIRYCNATPVFVDVDRRTLGLSASGLEQYLSENCTLRDDGSCWNNKTGRKITACLPMHTFGFPADLDALSVVCEKFNVPLVEDAAESLGSYYKDEHTGGRGKLSAISFNGNKIITTGGGGMILTNDEALAVHAKHLTTTAKVPHQSAFVHDEVGFNYRMPNINAALGMGQMQMLPAYLNSKRAVADAYISWGEKNSGEFFSETEGTHANYWLNTLILKDRSERDAMLEYTNREGVMTRPAWQPMHTLSIYADCPRDEQVNTEWLADRLINVPSSIVPDSISV